MTKKNKVIKKQAVKTEAVKPEITKEQKEEARNLITRQVVAREYAPVSHDTLSKSINYVTAGNGLFKVRKTPVAIFKEKVADIVDENMGIPDMEEGVELGIPKLPLRYLIEALSYYRDINDEDKTEASVLFFYNHNNVQLPEVEGMREENQIITYVPWQINSKTLSDFKDDTIVHWLRENTSLLLETHSHNTMGAFFSATDDANENNSQFYGVWGKVEDEEPQLAFRYVVGDSKVEVEPDILFEWPVVEETLTKTTTLSTSIIGDKGLLENIEEIETPLQNSEIEKEEHLTKGPFKQIEYPEDWMPKHSVAAPFVAKKYKGYTKHQNKNFGKPGESYASDAYGSGSNYLYEDDLHPGQTELIGHDDMPDSFDWDEFLQEEEWQREQAQYELELDLEEEGIREEEVADEQPLNEKVIDILAQIKKDYRVTYDMFTQ